ncbi:unnamed protein product [Trichobilharzia szidati]|nr:unnamed protein product [Trichobilharzia szidati]
MTALEDGSVNREKTCPLLLRMFCSTKKHNNVLEYSRGRTPLNELQVYTWLDATLRELASLVKQVNPESRRKGTLFDFALVFPDHRSPMYRMRELGTVCSGCPSDTDRIMLKDVQFTIGDMIDVAITLPHPSAIDVHNTTITTTNNNAYMFKDTPLSSLEPPNRRAIKPSLQQQQQQQPVMLKNRRSDEKYYDHSDQYRRRQMDIIDNGDVTTLKSRDHLSRGGGGDKESRDYDKRLYDKLSTGEERSTSGSSSYKVNGRRVVPY